MTFKKAICRGLLGFPIGVFISTTIGICISAAAGGGDKNFYSAIAPQMAQTFGGVFPAVVAQYFLSGVIGFIAVAGSAIFQIERWSYTRQILTHFLLLVGSFTPISIACGWYDTSAGAWGIVGYLLLFIAIYAVIWLCCTLYWKHRVRSLNGKMKQHNKS